MARNFPDLAARIEESLADRVLLNLHAQAHARAILSELRTPLAEQPQFTAGLDERLYLAANFLVCGGIDVLQGVGYENLSVRALTRGAESLEFLGTSATDRRFRTSSDTLKSAVAYHIAGHHARAYVLVERLRAKGSPGDWLSQIVLQLLDRNFLGLRNLTLDVFASAATNDAMLAALLERDDFDEATAISSLGERSLAEAVSIYLEYLKVGRVELLEEALAVVSGVTKLAREVRLVNLW